jgi:flagellar biosynthesis GTPase FlhF
MRLFQRIQATFSKSAHSTDHVAEVEKPGEQSGPHDDAPVERPEDDLLARDPFAARLARQIELVAPGRGLVMALIGPWGAGKTTVLKLAAKRLRSPSSGIDCGRRYPVEMPLASTDAVVNY